MTIHTLLDPGRPAQELASQLSSIRQAAGPGCFLTARLWLPDELAQARLSQDAARLGLDMAVQIKEINHFLAPGYVNAWGFLNEVPINLFPAWGLGQQSFNAILFDLPALAYGFASGASPIDNGQWQPLLAGLAAPNVVAISQHEYPVRTDFGDWTWREGRFVRSHEYLQRLGQGRTKWLITEFGYSGSVSDGLHGWKNSGLSAGAYANFICEYARRIKAYDYILGVAVFCASVPGDWDNFNVLGASEIEQAISVS